MMKEKLDISGVLYTLYAFEKDMRIENHLNLGFYLTMYTGGARSWHDGINEEDNIEAVRALKATTNYEPLWDARYHAGSISELVDEVIEGEISPDPDMTAFFDKSKHTGIPLSRTLEKLHGQDKMFRFESQWDSGYDVFFVDPSIRPSRIELDNKNRGIWERLGRGTSDLFPLPFVDWLKVSYAVRRLEDVNNWLVKNASNESYNIGR